jgi:putative aldouronate transport system substrate-binding protein
MNKRFLSLLLIASLTTSILAGCKGDKSTEGTADSGKSSVKIDDSKLKDPYNLPNNYSAYPVNNKKPLKVWWPIDAFQAVAVKDMNQHEVWQEVQKLTGINVEFTSPAVGQENEQFNLMISSGDLPDIIVGADKYKGGITAGIDDGVYIDHTDVINKYSPNYKQFREGSENRRKTTIDDKGRVLGYYNLEPYAEWTWFGLLIKKEALEKTGLPVPTTMAEWDAFLRKAKSVGYNQPLNFGSSYGTVWTGLMLSAYGAQDWVYKDKNGKAQWGPIQPGVKDYLAQMATWYKDGLINKDWATADFNQRMAEASSGDTAAMMDSPDTMWGVWKTQHNIDFVGAPYPVLNKGDKPTTTMYFFENVGWPASITTACKDVETAAKFLDFGYTKKGWEIFNWGIEGRTHEVNEKGMPYYPEKSLMWNDPDNIPLSNLVWKYKTHNGPFIRDEHNSNPLLVSPGSYSGQIRKEWEEGTDHSPAMPPVTRTPQEAAREAELGTQLATLRSETFSKIIMGQLPVSAFDDFVEKAKKMGSDEFISIWQKSLDRYNSR